MPKSAACDSTAVVLDRFRSPGAVASAISVPGWSPAAHLQATRATTTGAEARVIRFCAELEALERRIEALHREYRSLEDETRLDQAVAPVNRTVRSKLDRLCATACDTPAAILARLRLLAAVAPEWADARDAGDCIPSRLLAAILRDAGGSAA